MNQIELLGFEWLRKHGYEEKDIRFNCNKSPDFICSDGKRYEVKKIQKNQILFYPIQITSLKEDDIILVFQKENYVTNFLWKEREKPFSFRIYFNKEITIQIPKEILNQLQKEKINPNETYSNLFKRIIKENQKLKKKYKKLEENERFK